MSYLGVRAASSTVHVYFTTHAIAGGNVAPSSAFEAADIRVYKDGSATQRSSANGITMTSPFDSLVGVHHVSIDLADNTDAGFYAAGSFYTVILSPDETIEGQIFNGVVLAQFDIGVIPANVTQVMGASAVMTDLAAVPSATASILAAVNWLFELARNRITQTATTTTLFKDDGTTPVATSVVGDNGTTLDRAEYT